MASDVDLPIHSGTGKRYLWAYGPIKASLYFQLLMNYYKNNEIKALVDNVNWYIVPVVNVDGYEYTWTLVSAALPRVLGIQNQDP